MYLMYLYDVFIWCIYMMYLYDVTWFIVSHWWWKCWKRRLMKRKEKWRGKVEETGTYLFQIWIQSWFFLSASFDVMLLGSCKTLGFLALFFVFLLDVLGLGEAVIFDGSIVVFHKNGFSLCFNLKPDIKCQTTVMKLDIWKIRVGFDLSAQPREGVLHRS